MKKIFLSFLSILAVTTLVACGPNKKVIDYDSVVDLNLAVTQYESGQPITTITYQRDNVYKSTINNKEYKQGDLLPVWEEIGKKLNVNFVQKTVASDQGTDKQWARLKIEGFSGVDIVNHNIAGIAEEGLKGTFVDLASYLDYMPNFKKLLEENPSAKASIVASNGAIYSTPYFDGLGEIHRSLMARIDWIEDILDTTKAGDTTPAAALTNYTPKMPNSLSTKIKVTSADGTVRDVTKAYSKSIIKVLEEAPQTGLGLLNAFRSYFQTTYSAQGYTKLSEVFTGSDAAYDIDELIALWRVVKSNPNMLTKDNTTGVASSVEVYFPRQGTGNRVKDLFQSLHVLFGIRGTNAFNNEWLYFEQDGTISDVRYHKNTKFLDTVDVFSSLYNDGYMPQNPTTSTDYRKLYLEGSTGFMSYDYNATSSTDSIIQKAKSIDSDYNYQMILPPVHNWLGDGNYFHFTESVRDVQTQSWGILSSVAADEVKLYRALKLVDEMYDYSSDEAVGTIHMYGPKGWTDGVFRNYPSESPVYKLSEKSLQEMKDLSGGNNIRYLRQYVGATLAIGHLRSLGLEYQTLSTQAKEGFDKLALANQKGTYIYAGLQAVEAKKNPWFGMIPTSLPLSKEDTELMGQIANFRLLYGTSGTAPIIELLKFGFTGTNNRAQYENSFKLNGQDQYNLYIEIINQAYKKAQA